MSDERIRKLFPHASESFLKLHGFLDADVRYPKLKPTLREEPLVVNQKQKAGAGRTIVCITRYGVRLLDTDNAYGGCKPLIDALRYAGHIRDDDPASIQLIVTQKKVKKDQTGTSVIIIKP